MTTNADNEGKGEIPAEQSLAAKIRSVAEFMDSSADDLDFNELVALMRMLHDAADGLDELEKENAQLRQELAEARNYGFVQHDAVNQWAVFYETSQAKLAAAEASASVAQEAINTGPSSPFVYASIESQSGLHELWLLRRLADGRTDILDGPAKWPEGWAAKYFDAKNEARDFLPLKSAPVQPTPHDLPALESYRREVIEENKAKLTDLLNISFKGTMSEYGVKQCIETIANQLEAKPVQPTPHDLPALESYRREVQAQTCEELAASYDESASDTPWIAANMRRQAKIYRDGEKNVLKD